MPVVVVVKIQNVTREKNRTFLFIDELVRPKEKHTE